MTIRMIKTVLRIVLIAMCALSAIIGIVLGGIGIWILANKTKLRSLFNLIDTQSLPMLEKYKTDLEELVVKYDVISRVGLSFLMVCLIVIVVSSFGLYGSIAASKLFLMVYAILLGVLLVTVLILTIFCGLFKQRISATLSSRLWELQNKYFVSLIQMVKNPDTLKAIVTLALNFMHVSLKCCGVKTLGDSRNSSSWRSSERRILKLLAEGVSFGEDEPAKMMSDDYDIDKYSGGNLPDWMKFDVPDTVTMPPNYSVPTELPTGFELDENFFDELGTAVEKVVVETTNAITEVLDDALTLKTPVTCCQLDSIKKLLVNEFDIQMMYDNLQELSCVFDAENFGVNKVTCYDAMWSYLFQYVVPLIVLGSLLIFSLVAAIGSAVGIILLEE